MNAAQYLWGMALVLGPILAASAQTGAPSSSPTLTQVLMKSAANYRSCQTFRAETSWNRRIGNREFTATIKLTVARPNRFRLSATGAYFDTEVVSDGREVTALRMPRKLYVQRPAPRQLLGSDVLKDIHLPTPATRLLFAFLQGRWQDRSDPLIQRLHTAEVSGPMSLGNAMAYVLTFDYDADHSARLYISEDDWLVRRVALYRRGSPDIVETVVRTDLNPSLASEDFKLVLPEGAIRAEVLPRPEEPAVPVPLTVDTIDGRRIVLSDLKGSVVLLTFFFTTCPYCNEEMQYLQPVYGRVRGLGFEIIAVNGTGETVDEIKRWRDQLGLTFPVARNKTPSDLVTAFNVRAYPTNVLFDREGRVVHRSEGFDPQALLKAVGELGIR